MLLLHIFEWYHVSDRINDPKYSDFNVLYNIEGYVNTDTGRTSSYYFGMTDNKDDSLNDNGIKNSIKEIYFMNYQGETK